MTVYSVMVAGTIGNVAINIEGRYLALAWLCGFAGAIFDSILGATIQGLFRCPKCGRITEKDTHCGAPTVRFKGLHWINNDVVNFASTLFAALLMGVIMSTFGP